MKTAIIIHGSPDTEEYYSDNYPSPSNFHWLPWIQKKLLQKDVLAQTPEMPAPYNPVYSAWKNIFEQFSLNEETILIGHSSGGGFIVRYLSENNIKVGKVVLVAPWIDPEKELDTGMFDFVIDEKLALKTSGITVFNSSNDAKEIQMSVKKITDTVKNIKIIELQNRGHFTLNHLGTDAFPELLEELEN